MQISYIRTSTKEQEPELQIKDIQKLCPDCELVFYKEKLSAWKENVKRPVFAQIVSLIKAGKVQNLYVWDLDRLFRNRLRLKEFFLLCKMHNCKIHSANQTWLEEIHKIPPPFNDMVFELLLNLFGWIGEEESSKKSNRIKNAVIKKDNCKTVSYKGNVWGRKALSKQTINRVLELASTGISIREIANQVTAFDKNRNEKKISKSAVHKILAENAQ